MDAPLDIVWSRAVTGMPTTVPRDPAGRCFVSFLVEEGVGAGEVLNRGEDHHSEAFRPPPLENGADGADGLGAQSREA
jgi:hypothetical protein